MAAIGQSNPNPLPVHGRLWIDARTYGVSPANGDNTPALQAAIDAAGSLATALFNGGNNPIVTVFIPAAASPYFFQSPVYIDWNFVKVLGEGIDTRLSLTRGCSFPLFVIGLNRTRGGTVPNASYRPDLWNGGSAKLDTSVVTGAGQKWGVRTNTGMFALAGANHFTHGGTSSYGSSTTDSWGETRRLTIEFAIEGFSAGKVPDGTNVMGVGVYPTGTWQVDVSGGDNHFRLGIGTQAGKFGTPSYSFFTINSAATGVQRIAFQVDLVGGSVTATVNGVQVAVTGSPPPAGTTLNENTFSPFAINATADEGNGPRVDFALYGLCLSRSIRYTTPGVGLTVARADSGAISDRYRYFPLFSDDPNAVGNLGLAESPATAPRMLRIVGGGAACAVTNSAVFLVNADTFSTGATSDVWLSDLQITADVNYGSAATMFAVLEVHFERLDAEGGSYGLCNTPLEANYNIYISDCVLYGYDAGYLGYKSLMTADDVTFRNNGKYCWRLAGCNLRATDCYATTPGNPQYGFAALFNIGYGGYYEFNKVICDNEGDVYLNAGIYAERHGDTNTAVRLTDIDFGTMGSAPVVRLVGGGANFSAQPAILTMDRVVGSTSGPYIVGDGPEWIGTADNKLIDTISLVSNVGGQPVRVVVSDRHHAAPPHYGSWYRNTAVFPVPGAADGQFREIGVARDGVIGSAAPPQFIGRRPEQADLNASLALYAVDHTSIAATVSGRASSWGIPTNYGATGLSSVMFAASLGAAPTSWTVGLVTNPVSRPGTLGGGSPFSLFQPPGGSGYAAATVTNNSTNFTAASAGVKSNATAITFGTATAPYTVQGVYIADVGGNVWAVIQLASPLAVGIGTTPTIAIGGLTFTHTPLPGSQWGCLTDFAWGKVWDYCFRGTTYTPPAQFYAALTTAATSRTTAGLTEPSGNGYARVATGANWFTYNINQFEIVQRFGDVTNSAPIAFPSPTGSWGAVTGGALVDASSGGNVWAVAPLTAPAAQTSGTAAPTFANNAFLVTVD